jgi:monovalent cation/hydrogen antiporter
VTAGLYIGRQIPLIVPPHTRLQAAAVWKTVVFLINGMVFMMIGFQLPHVLPMVELESWGELAKQVAAVCGAAILVRIAWVYPATYLPRLLSPELRKRDPYPDWRYVAIVSWAGMRGVVSLAAAMALPIELGEGRPFTNRPIIVFIAFCVILATLVFQGLTLRPLIRWLGVATDDSDLEREENHARTQAAQAALARIESLSEEENVPESVASRLRAEYKERLEHLNDRDAEILGWSDKRILLVAIRRLRRAALTAERNELIKLLHQEEIGDEVLHRIQYELDLEESRMRK